MCLAIPGQSIESVDEPRHIATAEVSGVRRQVNIGLLSEGPDKVDVGDWVLIHVGFAMSKVDEEEANATRDFLLTLGEAYESELEELQKSDVG